ncbi:cytochrome P450 [Priestia megaterium]
MPSEDQLDFQRWSTALVDINDDSEYDKVNMEFVAYLEKLIEQKRVSPEEDLMSYLIQAEEGGERLTVSELYGVVMLLIVAGHETTVNLIANSLLALLTHPEQLALLKADPSS